MKRKSKKKIDVLTAGVALGSIAPGEWGGQGWAHAWKFSLFFMMPSTILLALAFIPWLGLPFNIAFGILGVAFFIAGMAYGEHGRGRIWNDLLDSKIADAEKMTVDEKEKLVRRKR